MTLKRIYVAGPYTKGNPISHVRNAVNAGDRLRRLGFVPFVPHLMMVWDIICPLEWEEYMAMDLAWIEVCDGLLRLPGESKGADIEVEYCRKHGKPVFYDIQELLESCST